MRGHLNVRFLLICRHYHLPYPPRIQFSVINFPCNSVLIILKIQSWRCNLETYLFVSWYFTTIQRVHNNSIELIFELGYAGSQNRISKLWHFGFPRRGVPGAVSDDTGRVWHPLVLHGDNSWSVCEYQLHHSLQDLSALQR